MNIQQEIKKIRVTIKESGELLALVQVEFKDFTIKGFRIWKNKKQNEYGSYCWVQPPMYLNKYAKNGWDPIIYFTNEQDYKYLSSEILNEYESKKMAEFTKIENNEPKDKFVSNKFQDDEDINVDKIDW